jgi:ribonuclease T1
MAWLFWLALALAAQALAFSGIGEIPVAALPPEGRETIALIRKGGPFLYAKDGATFGNREALLPKKARGYYREYTVKTPGSRDRGARRIVAGSAGELYYTEDHYRSFRRVLE